MASEGCEKLSELRLCDLKVEIEKRSLEKADVKMDHILDLVKRLQEALIDVNPDENLSTFPENGSATDCLNSSESDIASEDYHDCCNVDEFVVEDDADEKGAVEKPQDKSAEKSAKNVNSKDVSKSDSRKVTNDNGDEKSGGNTADEAESKSGTKDDSDQKTSSAKLSTINLRAPTLETITVVDTESKCLAAIKQIMSDCSEHPIAGFYCEWNHRRGVMQSKIGKVLVLSICTPRGYCALFRMNKFRTIPNCLKELLEKKGYGKDSVSKVGIGCVRDTSQLLTDYGIRTRRYSDLQEVLIPGPQSSMVPASLANQIKKILFDRDTSNFDHTKWLDDELTTESIKVAAKHAYACLLLYTQLDPRFFLTDVTSLGF